MVDRQERSGLLSALNFLMANGKVVNRPSDTYYEAMIGIAEKRLDKAGLAEVFRSALDAE